MWSFVSDPARGRGRPFSDNRAWQANGKLLAEPEQPLYGEYWPNRTLALRIDDGKVRNGNERTASCSWDCQRQPSTPTVPFIGTVMHEPP